MALSFGALCMDAEYQHPTSLLTSTTPTILHKYLWFDMHKPAKIMRNFKKSTVYESKFPLEDVQKSLYPIGRKNYICAINNMPPEDSFGSGEHNPKSECRTANHELSSACCFFWEDSEGGYTILHNIR